MVHCDAEHNDTPRRVAGDADIVPEERLEVARLADLRQRDAKAYDRHHPPLSGPEWIFAGDQIVDALSAGLEKARAFSAL
jgi:hypothetical protein